MPSAWREGNQFTLLPEASRFLPAILDAVKAAQHYVLVELYLMESGKLADQVSDALIDTAQRGVPVYLLLDGYGSMGLGDDDRQRLRDGGVQLRFFNPIGFHSLALNLSRDHRKIVVIDGELAFTGGFGAVDRARRPRKARAARATAPPAC